MPTFYAVATRAVKAQLNTAHRARVYTAMRNADFDTAMLELQLATLPVTPTENDRPANVPFDWSEDAIAAAFEREFAPRRAS
jgi:hypothetical protein